jgi:hypothetical protein
MFPQLQGARKGKPAVPPSDTDARKPPWGLGNSPGSGTPQKDTDDVRACPNRRFSPADLSSDLGGWPACFSLSAKNFVFLRCPVFPRQPHFFAFSPSSTSRRMASPLVIDSPVASIQASIAASSGWRQRSPICKPRPVVGGRPKRFWVVRLGFPLPSHFPHRAGKARVIGLLDCLTGAKPVPLHAVQSVSEAGNSSRNFFKLGRPPGKVNPNIRRFSN